MWFSTSRPTSTNTKQEVLSPKCNFLGKNCKPSYNFNEPKLQTFHTAIFVDQNCKPFIVQFFVDQNCKPFLVQFFWQKLQTFPWHTTTQVPYTPKRPIELWWQLQNQLFTFIVFFYYFFSSYYSMWDFGEYPLVNQQFHHGFWFKKFFKAILFLHAVILLYIL